MTILLTILHVAVCIFLILVVLLQTGKSADLAGAFGGGGSQTALGSRGAATLLSKLTTISAVLFMVTSLSLAVLFTRQSESVMDRVDETLPAAGDYGVPGTPPAGTPTGQPGTQPGGQPAAQPEGAGMPAGVPADVDAVPAGGELPADAGAGGAEAGGGAQAGDAAGDATGSGD